MHRTWWYRNAEPHTVKAHTPLGDLSAASEPKPPTGPISNARMHRVKLLTFGSILQKLR